MKMTKKDIWEESQSCFNYYIRHLWAFGHWCNIWLQFVFCPFCARSKLMYPAFMGVQEDLPGRLGQRDQLFVDGDPPIQPRLKPRIYYIWMWSFTLEAKEVPHSKSLCSHEDQDGNERHSHSAPFPRASHPSTGQVYCQEEFQVVSRLSLILTNHVFLDRSVSVIASVSECSGETVVLHFPFMAWPQQWQP